MRCALWPVFSRVKRKFLDGQHCQSGSQLRKGAWLPRSFTLFRLVTCSPTDESAVAGHMSHVTRHCFAASAARYSVTVDAGMGQAHHQGSCGGDCKIRIHAEARIEARRGCSPAKCQHV
jgi:hypothetical protein